MPLTRPISASFQVSAAKGQWPAKLRYRKFGKTQAGKEVR